MKRVAGWPYLYRHNNSSLYYVRRIPRDLEDMVSERQFRRSLKHRDERLPAFKAAYDAVHREVESYIARLRQGMAAPDALKEYEIAVAHAQRLGFDFRPIHEISDAEITGLDEFIDRLKTVEKLLEHGPSAAMDGVLGTVKRPSLSWKTALDEFEDQHRAEHRGKNANQRRRWRNPLDLAIRNFEEVTGAASLEETTRNDALKFREWWAERIGKDVDSANTANKNLMALRKIFRTMNDTYRLGLENPFDGLRISDDGQKVRISLARDWLEATMLTEDALSGLNPEARGIILAMADTGARINEITGLEPNDIKLEEAVPHIVLRPNSIRSLKTRHSNRVIPLVGVALTAMTANPGGFPRYAGKNASASGAINKYLREHGLLPDGATLYGLRHGFQDRLIEVEAPERIQADLMGHKTLRPKYGKGPSLLQMREWLLKTALHRKGMTRKEGVRAA